MCFLSEQFAMPRSLFGGFERCRWKLQLKFRDRFVDFMGRPFDKHNVSNNTGRTFGPPVPWTLSGDLGHVARSRVNGHRMGRGFPIRYSGTRTR
jgi:hypothetical protein